MDIATINAKLVRLENAKKEMQEQNMKDKKKKGDEEPNKKIDART